VFRSFHTLLRGAAIATLALSGCDGGSCMFNSQCPAGSYCSEGACVMGCTADAECEADETCSVFGECVARAANDGGCDGTDGDGDGYCAGSGSLADCDDDDAAAHPGADEICTASSPGAEERDEDCDGRADEDCAFYFGRPHAVLSVHASAGNHWFPRISPDGLTMRFGATNRAGVATVHRASRPSADAAFGPAEIDPDFPGWETGGIHVITIRGDGLEAYAQRGGTETVRGVRASTSEPFGAPEVAFANARHPFVSHDGLELFVEELSMAPSVIGRATRASTSEPFGALERLALSGVTTRDYAPYLSPDGSTLLFFRVVVAGNRRLFAATRASSSEPFGEPFELPSFSDQGEGAFYHAPTRELFYSSLSTSAPASVGIYRAQVCRDAPCDSPRIECPSGLRSADGLSCYFGVTSPLAWMEAEQDCVARGGHLASIHSIPDAALADAVGGAAPFWIGANDLAAEGTLAWSSGAPATRSLWGTAEPDDTMAASNCVQGPAAAWNDADCASALPYVCETEAWPTW
jgi:hypothetical protein